MKFRDDKNNAFVEYDVGKLSGPGISDDGEWWLTKTLAIGEIRGGFEKIAKFNDERESEQFSAWLRELIRAKVLP